MQHFQWHRHALGSIAYAVLATACGDSGSAGNPAVVSGAGGSVTAGQGATAGAAAGHSSLPSGAAGRSGSGASGSNAGAAGAANGGASDTGSSASAGSNASAGMGAAAGVGAAGATTAGTGAAAGNGAAGAAGAMATGECDRACLLAVMQGYLDALIAKDPSKLMVSPTLKYTENGVVVKLGDGLWKTASMLVPDARLDFADPTMMNVASQVVVNENGTTPVLYQARLKVVDHQITEIESMAVRRQGAANGFFNPAAMKPEAVFLQEIDPAKRMTRDAMHTTIEMYLDYLEGKKSGSEVPFDSMCKRYENGQVTASGLSSFAAQSWGFQVTRRTLIMDEEAGIVWGMYPFSQSATALVVGEAFKMIEGKIMMIQAVMANQPTKVWD